MKANKGISAIIMLAATATFVNSASLSALLHQAVASSHPQLHVTSSGLLPGLGELAHYPSLTASSRHAAPPAVYTAIGYDDQDHASQMRVTLTPRGAAPRDWDAPMDWYMHGTFLGSADGHQQGKWTVVVTEGGRTRDGCHPDSLGRVLTAASQNPFSQGYSLVGAARDGLAVGVGGATVWASRLAGVSRGQLAGAGLAVCQAVRRGRCVGRIAWCGTVARDLHPAMEVPLDSQADRHVNFDNGMGGFDNFGDYGEFDFGDVRSTDGFSLNDLRGGDGSFGDVRSGNFRSARPGSLAVAMPQGSASSPRPRTELFRPDLAGDVMADVMHDLDWLS